MSGLQDRASSPRHGGQAMLNLLHPDRVAMHLLKVFIVGEEKLGGKTGKAKSETILGKVQSTLELLQSTLVKIQLTLELL